MHRTLWTLSILTGICILPPIQNASAQEVKAPTLKYVMTYQADVGPALPVSENLIIFNVYGGWVKTVDGGTGTFIEPSGDWLQVLPNGTFKLDVRASVKMDDGSVILVEYTGRAKLSAAGAEKLNKGQKISGDDALYFITSPTMRTMSKKYGWVNDAVFVNKYIERSINPSYIKYDVYMVVP